MAFAYRSGANYAEWFLELSDIYQIGKNLGFDLGMPGLEIVGNGGVDLSISWNLKFGIGVSEQNGFYFIFDDTVTNDFDAKAEFKFKDDTKIEGSISKLSMLLELDSDDYAGFDFGVDLGAGTGNHISDVIGDINLSLMAGVNITSVITVGFDKIEDGSKYPKFNGNFTFDWDVYNIYGRESARLF